MPSRIGEERGALYGSRREFVWARNERTLQPEFACLEEQRAQGFEMTQANQETKERKGCICSNVAEDEGVPKSRPLPVPARNEEARRPASREAFLRDQENRDKCFKESMRQHALRFLEDSSKADSAEVARQGKFMLDFENTWVMKLGYYDKAFQRMQGSQERKYLHSRQRRDGVFDKSVSIWETVIGQQLSTQKARSASFLASWETVGNMIQEMHMQTFSHWKRRLEEVFDTVVQPLVRNYDEICKADMQEWATRIQMAESSQSINHPVVMEPLTHQEYYEHIPVPNWNYEQKSSPTMDPYSLTMPDSEPLSPASTSAAAGVPKKGKESSLLPSVPPAPPIQMPQNKHLLTPASHKTKISKKAPIDSLSLKKEFQQYQDWNQEEFVKAEDSRDEGWKHAERRRNEGETHRAVVFGEVFNKMKEELDRQRSFYHNSFQGLETERNTEDKTRQAYFAAELRSWSHIFRVMESRRDSEYSVLCRLHQDLLARIRTMVSDMMKAFEEWVKARLERQKGAFRMFLPTEESPMPGMMPGLDGDPGWFPHAQPHTVSTGSAAPSLPKKVPEHPIQYEHTSGVGIRNIFAPVHIHRPLEIPRSGDMAFFHDSPSAEEKHETYSRFQRLFEDAQRRREIQFATSSRGRRREFELAEAERRDWFSRGQRERREAQRRLQTTQEICFTHDQQARRLGFITSEERRTRKFEAAQARRDAAFFSYIARQQSDYKKTQKDREEMLMQEVGTQQTQYQAWETHVLLFIADWGARLSKSLETDRQDRVRAVEGHISKLSSHAAAHGTE
ncbi:hypothetical protein GLOTRDRAFT_130386 [Gloeophyllum trabeum ATCC 11539]|uniref:Uncharacterized protein n=1 Tax=Gloeophyllum trabeum (strain ATCC 11539 / FP-39264 / Madison 617) TaxID=670483 RepID=S7RI95_GLOTA|nr:uncharacterized protein GLOTRDRAFT_130386 [Gloeophyllum trabeum ATCC 11539]EPQ53995.1 hypothetical protein GLOTRDRAFT_130386 [Gloeophyllum trabeum ATCC 11539]